jgi:hypothetical protein
VCRARLKDAGIEIYRFCHDPYPFRQRVSIRRGDEERHLEALVGADGVPAARIELEGRACREGVLLAFVDDGRLAVEGKQERIARSGMLGEAASGVECHLDELQVCIVGKVAVHDAAVSVRHSICEREGLACLGGKVRGRVLCESDLEVDGVLRRMLAGRDIDRREVGVSCLEGGRIGSGLLERARDDIVDLRVAIELGRDVGVLAEAEIGDGVAVRILDGPGDRAALGCWILVCDGEGASCCLVHRVPPG